MMTFFLVFCILTALIMGILFGYDFAKNNPRHIFFGSLTGFFVVFSAFFGFLAFYEIQHDSFYAGYHKGLAEFSGLLTRPPSTLGPHF